MPSETQASSRYSVVPRNQFAASQGGHCAPRAAMVSGVHTAWARSSSTNCSKASGKNRKNSTSGTPRTMLV
jgi:hypothetical protein